MWTVDLAVLLFSLGLGLLVGGMIGRYVRPSSRGRYRMASTHADAGHAVGQDLHLILNVLNRAAMATVHDESLQNGIDYLARYISASHGKAVDRSPPSAVQRAMHLALSRLSVEAWLRGVEVPDGLSEPSGDFSSALKAASVDHGALAGQIHDALMPWVETGRPPVRVMLREASTGHLALIVSIESTGCDTSVVGPAEWTRTGPTEWVAVLELPDWGQ